MVKQSKNNPRPIIVIIITFIILASIIAINCYIFYNKHEIKTLNNEYKKEITNYDYEIANYSSDKKEILLNIDFLNNIDELIYNQKNEYFKSIKELEDKILAGESDQKIAYITFDDGPYNLTRSYLEVLDKYDVSATFFVIGLGKTRCLDNRSLDCTEVYKELANHGHTIANHTYSHAIWAGLYGSADAFIAQVTQMENIIKDKTGNITNIVRFPGGSRTAGWLKDSIITKLRAKGYGWVDWTAADGDGGELGSKEEAMANIKSSINDKIEVVLLHDYNRITLSVLPDIIEYLREKGYILLPLFYESNMVNK